MLAASPRGGHRGAFRRGRLFAAPAPARNAAPLYLDALLEFGPELVDTLPPGPAGELRETVAGRVLRMTKLSTAADQDWGRFGPPKSTRWSGIVPGGFRELALAQRGATAASSRPGSAPTALLTHAQAARNVARAAI